MEESLYVCPSIFLTTVHLIDFTLTGCIAEDLRNCSVECEVVWLSSSQEACSEQAGHEHWRVYCWGPKEVQCRVWSSFTHTHTHTHSDTHTHIRTHTHTHVMGGEKGFSLKVPNECTYVRLRVMSTTQHADRTFVTLLLFYLFSIISLL